MTAKEKMRANDLIETNGKIAKAVTPIFDVGDFTLQRSVRALMICGADLIHFCGGDISEEEFVEDARYCYKAGKWTHDVKKRALEIMAEK